MTRTLMFLIAIASSAALPRVHAEQTTLADSPARDGAPSPPGSSSIRGRVMAIDTNTPLRVAGVTLTGEPPFRAQYTATDADGRYRFTNLPAGRFTVTATKETYLALAYGQTRPAEAGRPLTVGEKQVVDNIDFALPRGGVIAGVVVDGFGDPVIGAGVTPMRSTYKDGQRSVVAAATAETTNDLGEFRLTGLMPGSYYVSVRKVTSVPVGAVITSSLMYPSLSFAPGAPGLEDAQRVTVELGKTVSGINIVMSRVPTVTVSGTVLDFDGAVVPGATVTLLRPGVVNVMPPSSITGVNARITSGFSITGVPPGSYELRAIAGVSRLTGPAPAPQAARGSVIVNGVSLTDVKLQPVKIATLTGRIVVDPQSPAPLPVAAVSLGMRSLDPADPPTWTAEPRPVPIQRDQSFSLRALPGRWRLTGSLPKGWGLKTVRVGGVDVTDSGIEVREGVDIREIEIELTGRAPQVSGRVRGPQGEPIADYTVLIFSRDRANWNGNSRYFAMARPDQDSRFTTGPLAPGDYFAIALDYVNVDDAQDPDLLNRVSSVATGMTLVDAEQKQIELTIVR